MKDKTNTFILFINIQDKMGKKSSQAQKSNNYTILRMP